MFLAEMGRCSAARARPGDRVGPMTDDDIGRELLPRCQLDSAPAGVADAYSANEAVLKRDDERSRTDLIYRSEEKDGEAVVARRIRVVHFDLPADLSGQARMRRGQWRPSLPKGTPARFSRPVRRAVRSADHSSSRRRVKEVVERRGFEGYRRRTRRESTRGGATRR